MDHVLNRLACLWISAVAYAASATPPCATCHPQQAARFAQTPMGRSLIAPEPVAAPATVSHPRSGSTIAITQPSGLPAAMQHTLTERGLTSTHVIGYQVGNQVMGRTYLVPFGDTLFESPASWFKSYGWDVSPGYGSSAMIDFDRPITAECLFCHSGNASFKDPDGRHLVNTALAPITCERCHGSGVAHSQKPSAKNIINPAKLTGAARDSVCEQCHLEGVARVLHNSKQWTDVHPGVPTEQTYSTYVLPGAGRETIAVSHSEQLAQSQCARSSGGKLWCGTCHDPHGSAAVVNVTTTCRTCHPSLPAASHPPAAQLECVSCHMPRRETTDISHAALTDHRILRRPAAAGSDPSVSAIQPWRETSTPRDLALGEVLAGFAKHLPSLTQSGFTHLAALPKEQTANDPDVLSALAGLYLQNNQLPDARAAAARLVQLRPDSAKAALNFALVLKRTGESAEAETQLLRAAALDRSLKQAFIELAGLYAGQRRMDRLAAIMDQYLEWNPQDILFRLQRSSLHP